MSFDIGPSKQPVIRESQNMQNDGGGGNLGYFKKRRKKGDPENEEDSPKLLEKEDDVDKIELRIAEDDKNEEDDSSGFHPGKWLGNIVNKIVDTAEQKKNENPFM